MIASSRKTTCSTQALKNVYSVVGFFQKTDVCSEGYQNFFAWLAIVFASSQKTEADTCSDMLKDVLRLLLIPISSHDHAGHVALKCTCRDALHTIVIAPWFTVFLPGTASFLSSFFKNTFQSPSIQLICV